MSIVPVTTGVWLAADGRHDTRSGEDVVTPLTPAEEADLIDYELAEAIDMLAEARQVALADVPDAQTRQGQAVALRDTLTTRAGQVSASTPAVTVAYLTAVRDQLAWLMTQAATMASAHEEHYVYRARSANGLAYAYWMLNRVAHLGRYLVQRLTGG